MRKTLLKILIAASFVFIVFAVFTTGYILNLKSGVSENILRLHIVGASNEQIDQNLKLFVRDRILKDYSAIFSECNTISESLSCAESKLPEIESSAKDELMKYGCTQDVSAELETCSFPTKVYEDISLPCGKYTALNIKIGDANGKNWWCVMYPPLCVTDSIITVPDSSKEKLKMVLSEDEYNFITNSNGCEIRFKIAEIIGRYI